jgi:ketosteroid isomerase-like protein
LIEQLYAGLARGDNSMFRQLAHPDIRMVVTGTNSWSQCVHGIDKVAEFYRYVYSRLRGPGKVVPERFIADGDLVVVEAKGDRVALSGERYDNHYCLVFELREGRIVELREYQDSSLCERVLGPYPGERKGVV